MPQRSSSPVILTLVLMLAAVVPQQASAPQQPPPPSAGAPRRAAGRTAASAAGADRHRDARAARPVQRAGRARGHAVGRRRRMLRNPTNIDIDKDGRIWVAEGVRYRSHHARQPEGDRIVVLQDTDGDGKADKHAHVRPGAGAHRAARRLGHRQQDHRRAAARPDRLHRRRPQPALRSGGGQARGAADRLPGRQPRPLAALGDGRPGRQVDLQRRQHRRDVHRQVGQDVPHLRRVPRRPGRAVQVPARPGALRRQAERRRARVCRRLHGADESRRHQRRDHRPQLPQQLRAVGDVARRRLPERQRRPAGLPRQLGDGVRELRLLVERRAADVAGGPPAGPDDAGGGVAAGRSGHDAGRRRLRRRLADRQRVLRERRARRGVGRHVPRAPMPGATRSSRTSRRARAPASRSTARSS